MRLTLLIFGAFVASAIASKEKKIVCYFGSWAVYRPGKGEFPVASIDPSMCSHLVYTFVGITPSGDIRLLDPWGDLSASDPGGNKNSINLFNQLRGRCPTTKTLIAIGGWNEGSANFSDVAADPTKRKAFAENAVKFARMYGFDGFDIDWEYPAQRNGGKPQDKENYVLLLKEMRRSFDEVGGLLLTAAVGAAKTSAIKSYKIKEISDYLDFINLMAYDFHVAGDGKTGINAPLYPGSWESGDERYLNVNESVHYWIEQGAPCEKIVLGLPFYSRTFTLSDPQENGIGAPAKGPGTAGPYTKEPGTLGYNELCEKLLNEKGQWKLTFEEEQRVPFAVNGDQWVGYENPTSVKEKADLINELGLGGAMVWSIETDDFRGICGEKYPLLKTLNHVLRGGPPPSGKW